MQKLELLKVRDFGAIFNDTFAFIRQNFWPIVKPCITIAGPLFFIAGMLYGRGLGSYYKTMFSSIGEEVPPNFEAMESSIMDMFMNFGIAYIFVFIAFVLFITLINSYIILYRKDNYKPNELTTALVWQEAKQHLGKIIISFIVITMLIFIGSMLCFIPGIFLSAPLSLIFILRMEERELSLGKAIRKCFMLTENYWWLTFGIIILLFLIYSVVGSTLSLPVTLILAGSSFFDVGIVGDIFQSLFMGITYLFTFLLSGIMYVGIAVTYYSHRERIEGIVLSNKIDNLGIE